MHYKVITFEEWWARIESRDFKPLAAVLDQGGYYRQRHGALGPAEWSNTYTTVYKMYVHDCAPRLYEKVEETLRACLRDNTLPTLHKLGEENMLKEVVRRWENRKLMVKWILTIG